jgi:hypothetical protein
MIYRKCVLFFIALCVLITCNKNIMNKEQSGHTPSLEKIWESDTTLIANESAVYHAGTNALYVSCMGKHDDVKDGDGFIAKLSLDGKIEKLKWIPNLNCPKGMAIKDNTIYVTDIDEVVSIDVYTGSVQKEKLGAHFNDIDVAPNGDLYLSEGQAAQVVKVHNHKAEVYYAGAETRSLNGVHVYDQGIMFTGNMGNIYGISEEKKISILADSCFQADGIEKYGKGYFCSSWKGRVYYFSPGGNTTKLIDTENIKLQAGDIEVVEKKNLLVCPTLFNNKVIGYRVK